jgi:hypothetical protein
MSLRLFRREGSRRHEPKTNKSSGAAATMLVVPRGGRRGEFVRRGGGKASANHNSCTIACGRCLRHVPGSRKTRIRFPIRLIPLMNQRHRGAGSSRVGLASVLDAPQSTSPTLARPSKLRPLQALTGKRTAGEPCPRP